VAVEVPELSVLAEPCALTNSVIGNLVSNAIKFSHSGGSIEIRAHQEGGMVCVQVCDHGLGMPAEVLNHLFDISKGHSRKGTAGEKGTGFGMPLMRKFVTLFGGRVEVESREQGPQSPSGTEFRVWLKLA
jgi:signal transduction histidine kinase